MIVKGHVRVGEDHVRRVRRICVRMSWCKEPSDLMDVVSKPLKFELPRRFQILLQPWLVDQTHN